MRLTVTLFTTLSLLAACAGPASRPGTAPTATTAPSENPVTEPANDPDEVSLAGIEGSWTLVELPRGTTLPEGVDIRLTFEGTTVSGSSGCNSYSGTITEKKAGELEPGLFSGTEKFCEGPVMDVEGEYLRALASATTYTLLGARLEITYSTGEDATAAMVFARTD
jgi:heat shock protein HslJ